MDIFLKLLYTVHTFCLCVNDLIINVMSSILLQMSTKTFLIDPSTDQRVHVEWRFPLYRVRSVVMVFSVQLAASRGARPTPFTFSTPSTQVMSLLHPPPQQYQRENATLYSPLSLDPSPVNGRFSQKTIVYWILEKSVCYQRLSNRSYVAKGKCL